MNPPALVLASASPRRAALLRELGLEFSIRPGHPPEVEPEHLTPHETAQINAYRKARVVAQQEPAALVLGADTVVCLGTRLFGKPAHRREAEAMLAQLQGRTHEVVTGVCLIHRRAHRLRTFAVSTLVTFRRLQPGQIRQYLARIDPLDKAGGYAIQEHGDLIVQEIQGSYSNVVGLPLEQLRIAWKTWGGS